jgi:hypothetical protein
VKAASDGHGLIVRVLNPTDYGLGAHLRLRGPTTSVSAVRLDETLTGDSIQIVDGSARFDVPPHALRSVLVR